MITMFLQPTMISSQPFQFRCKDQDLDHAQHSKMIATPLLSLLLGNGDTCGWSKYRAEREELITESAYCTSLLQALPSDESVVEPTPMAPRHYCKVVQDPKDIQRMRLGIHMDSSCDAMKDSCSTLLELLPILELLDGCDEKYTSAVAAPSTSADHKIDAQEHWSDNKIRPISVSPSFASPSSDDEYGCPMDISNKSTSSASPPSAQMRSQRNWTMRYHELLEFYRKHGHSNIPNTYPQNIALGFWTKRTRLNYKLYLQGKPSNITAERAAMLDQVDFQWGRQDRSWQGHYRALANFKKLNGHMRVPFASMKDRPLFHWIKRQRKLMRLYLKGARHSLSPARFELLMKLGVEV